MCVAVLIESDRGPTRDELLAMELDNPHGGGVAYPEGDRIRYKKGLSWRQIHKVLARVPRPCLLHFRWATHGGRAAHLTHPFPLGPRALVSKALTGVAPAVLIHNGVWYSYADFIPDWAQNRKDQLSDTAVAAYVAEKWEAVLDDVDWSNAVMRSSGRGRADVTLRGRWVEHNGDLYSNLNWQARTKRWSAPMTEIGTTRQPSHSAYDEMPWGYEEWIAARDVLSDDDPSEPGDLTQQFFAGYPPKDPRWTADGRLVEGGRVRKVDVIDTGVPAYEGNPIPDWVAEHQEVQAALAAMAEDE